MDPLRLIFSDAKGNIIAQMLDVPETRPVSDGRYESEALAALLLRVRAANPKRLVLGTALQYVTERVRRHDLVSVRRARALEGRYPKKLAMGSSPSV